MSRLDLIVAVTESTELRISVDDVFMPPLRVPLPAKPEEASLEDRIEIEVGGDVEIVMTPTEIRSIS